MRKICSGLSTFGFISERQTLVCLFLFTVGDQILLLHMLQLGGDRIGLVLNNNSCSSEFHFYTHSSPEQTSSTATTLTWSSGKTHGHGFAQSACQRPKAANCVNHSCLGRSMDSKIIEKTRSSLTSSFQSQSTTGYQCNLHKRPAVCTAPQLPKWLEYLLANSCLLVENIQIIIFAVCLKA